jgi:hemoglobin
LAPLRGAGHGSAFSLPRAAPRGIHQAPGARHRAAPGRGAKGNICLAPADANDRGIVVPVVKPRKGLFMFAPWLRTLAPAVAGLALLAGLATARAAEGGGDKKDLDKKVIKLLAETMDLGAETYNSGRREECYFLYLGTLRSLRLTLDHRPDLQKVIDEKIAAAKGKPSVVERAFTLREALDQCYMVIGKDLGMTIGQPKKTLWDRLGGEAAVRTVVHDFVLSAAGDPKVNIDRNGKYKLTPDAVKDLEQKLVELISAVSGGPLKYTGKDMKTVHKGMGITDEEFNALAGHLVKTLQKYKVSEADIKSVVEAVAATRKDIVEKTDGGKDKDKGKEKKSLYDRLGGEKAITAVVEELAKKAAANPKVNFLRKGVEGAEIKEPSAEDMARIKKNLVDFIGEATGGPQKYKGKDMKTVHKGMKITNEEFNALAADLKAVLDQFKVPQAEQEELMAIVGSTRSAIVEEKKKQD